MSSAIGPRTPQRGESERARSNAIHAWMYRLLVVMFLAVAVAPLPVAAQSTCAEALAGTPVPYISDGCSSGAPDQSFGPMDYCMISNAVGYPDGSLAFVGMGWRCNGGLNLYRIHLYWCTTPGVPFVDCLTPSTPPPVSSTSDDFCDSGSMCVKAYGWLRELLVPAPDRKTRDNRFNHATVVGVRGRAPSGSSSILVAGQSVAVDERDSSGLLLVETTFPASLPEPQIGVPVIWEQPGDGDWLTIKLDTTVVWQGIGTDFPANTIQYAMIPSAGLAGSTHRMLFQLHSAGARNARVLVWDTPSPIVLSGAFPGRFSHSPLVGDGIPGSSGDGGPATSARLASPSAVVRDPSGNLYIADRDNHRVRRVDALSGDIATYAGTGTAGYSGDGGPAASALLSSPTGLAFDLDGSLFIADRDNHRVRRVDKVSGEIATVAGNGTGGYTVDGVVATATALNAPTGVAVDSLGNLLIADRDNHRVRRVQSGTQLISTVAGTFGWGAGPNGIATNSKLHAPEAVAVDAQDRVLIADSGNHQVRRVNLAMNQIERLAGRRFPVPDTAGDLLIRPSEV